MSRKTDIEEQLRQIILKAEISCYRLAALSGVSKGAISHFVNRNRSITMTTAAKLAAVLDLELLSRKQTKGR